MNQFSTTPMTEAQRYAYLVDSERNGRIAALTAHIDTNGPLLDAARKDYRRISTTANLRKVAELESPFMNAKRELESLQAKGPVSSIAVPLEAIRPEYLLLINNLRAAAMQNPDHGANWAREVLARVGLTSVQHAATMSNEDLQMLCELVRSEAAKP